ncbi:immunoglobulin lambda-1 light chain [Triplophysa dalaica]|uniref:immunoglobulin lambda-1 light chain n=1 Tax=Triplophysa dalaica TaxID=1582913 RepID=UPI0024DF9D29|nr:immunoglobulin lambda-1 light chain [Triplophysa dalaica]
MNEHNRMKLSVMILSPLLLSCVFGDNAQMNLIFSRGLRLIVEVPHVVFHHLGTPKVHLLLPVQVQSKRPGAVTLVCVITGLRSKAVRITWKVNETSGLRKHTSTAEVHRGPRGTFSAVGLYTVLAHKWSHENTYQCEVTYKERFNYNKAESSLCNPPF